MMFAGCVELVAEESGLSLKLDDLITRQCYEALRGSGGKAELSRGGIVCLRYFGGYSV